MSIYSLKVRTEQKKSIIFDTRNERITAQKMKYFIPVDRNAWLEFLITLVKQKVCVTYLTDQDLKTVINGARKTIAKQFSRVDPPFDPNLPEAYYWNEYQVAEWIAENGYPELREAFLINHINGRKLVAVDASALCKMGLKYFDMIQDVAGKIRELLDIPRPNMMRALARMVPMELYLRKKIRSGRSYDMLTFEKFCKKMGFPYDYLMATDNRNALIPCTVKMMIYLGESIMSPVDSDDSSGAQSLIDAPSVEYVARNAWMRNRIVQRIIEEILNMVFTPAHLRKYGKLGVPLDTLSSLLNQGLRELGMDDVTNEFAKERLEFATQVGKSLIKEMLRTTEVLQDIHKTRKSLRRNIREEEYLDMKLAAELFLEEVMPIAALLGLGELELEKIFEKEPDFQYFVDDIAGQAEAISNELVPEAEVFIDEVITEAKLKIISRLYPDLPQDTVRTASSMIDNLLDDLIEHAVAFPLDNKNKDKQPQQQEQKQDEGVMDKSMADDGDPFSIHRKYPTKDFTEGWKKMVQNGRKKRPRHYEKEDKVDDSGYPILSRLTSTELLKIVLSNGDASETDFTTGHANLEPSNVPKEKLYKDAVMEQARRRQADLQASWKDQIYRRNFPGLIDELGHYREFNILEKFGGPGAGHGHGHGMGAPLVERLNMDELQEIIDRGHILGRKLSVDTIAQAHEEKQKRAREELQDNIQLENFQRSYPGVHFNDPGFSLAPGVGLHLTFREFSLDEKFDPLTRRPIVPRLNTDELDYLIEYGEFNNLSFHNQPKVLAEANMEKQRRDLEDLRQAQKVKSHRRIYPGRLDEAGAYHEFRGEEKLNANRNPIVSRLNLEELERIIDKETMDIPGGQKLVNSSIVSLAKAEKRMRKMDEEDEQVQEKYYRLRFPGKTDPITDHFIPWSEEEKVDKNGLPIFERLTSPQLEELIETRKFKGVTIHALDIIDRARVEKQSREQEVILQRIKQQEYQKQYPGQIVQGVFREFSQEQKWDLDSANGPRVLVERLNNEELEEILTEGTVLTPYSGRKKVSDPEVLLQAKMEQDRREQELVHDKIQGNLYKRKPTVLRAKLAEYRDMYKAHEKFDVKGQPILQRMTNEELDKIINGERLSIVSLDSDFGYGKTGDAGEKEDKGQHEIINEGGSFSKEVRQEATKLKAKREEEQKTHEEPIYRKQFPRSVPRLDDVNYMDGENARMKLEEYLERFKRDNKKVDDELEEKARRETVQALIELIQLEYREGINDGGKDQEKTDADGEEGIAEAERRNSLANLAIFNGFVIDDVANVVGTVDPFDGTIRDQKGAVIGVINSEGILFTNAGLSLGKVGADVEQISVGKFRALPKSIPSQRQRRKTLRQQQPRVDVVVKPDGAIARAKRAAGFVLEEKVAPWNSLQAQVKGGILTKQGNDWIRDDRNVPHDAYSNAKLAQQIQATEGYDPSQVLLLEPEAIVEPLGEQGRTKKNEAPGTAFVWLRADKQKPKAKTLIARMMQGDEVELPLIDLRKLAPKNPADVDVDVLVPTSQKWGVQQPPENVDEPHPFKPPPANFTPFSLNPPPVLSSIAPTAAAVQQAPVQGQGQSEGPDLSKPVPVQLRPNDLFSKVQTGEAKQLVDPKGSPIGEIKKDGHIYNAAGKYVGHMQKNGIIVKEEGSALKDQGIKVIRQNGVVVGHVNEKGKLSLTKDTDRLLIGRIWGDGRIVTLDNRLVGVVLKDGRIMGVNQTPIGLFTPTWELLGADGIPFAYVTSEGKIYRYEVIRQARYVPQSKDGFDPTLALDKRESIEDAFENPPLPNARASLPLSTTNANPRELDGEQDFHRKISEETDTETDAEFLQRIAEKERIFLLERERQQYDLDESHKHSKVKAMPETEWVQPQSVASKPMQQKKLEKAKVESAPKAGPPVGPLPMDNLGARSTMDHRVSVREQFLAKKMKRRSQLVENWAHEVTSGGNFHGTSIFSIDQELTVDDRRRLAGLAADSILDDIFKLALTRLLLQAEAGENTQKIMDCLAKIQTTGNDEDAQAMWDIHLSQSAAAIQALQNAARLLPKPGDRGVLKVAQNIAKNRRISLKEKVDKGIQQEAKVETGVNTRPGNPQYYQKQPLPPQGGGRHSTDGRRHTHYEDEHEYGRNSLNHSPQVKKHFLPPAPGFGHVIRPSQIEDRDFDELDVSPGHGRAHLQHIPIFAHQPHPAGKVEQEEDLELRKIVEQIHHGEATLAQGNFLRAAKQI